MPCLWSHGSPSDLDAVNDLSSLDSSTALLTTPGSSWVRHSLLRPRAEHCLALFSRAQDGSDRIRGHELGNDKSVSRDVFD